MKNEIGQFPANHWFFPRKRKTSMEQSSRRLLLKANSFIFLVRQEGFEPPTHGLEGRCSIQLSYWRRDFLCVANVAVLFQKGKLSLHKASFSCAKPSCLFSLQSRASNACIYSGKAKIQFALSKPISIALPVPRLARQVYRRH